MKTIDSAMQGPPYHYGWHVGLGNGASHGLWRLAHKCDSCDNYFLESSVSCHCSGGLGTARVHSGAELNNAFTTDSLDPFRFQDTFTFSPLRLVMFRRFLR